MDLEILQRPHPQMAGFATKEAASKEKASKEAPSKDKSSKEAASKEQASKEATSNRKPPTPGEGGFLFWGVLDPHKRIPYMDNKIPYLFFCSSPGGGVSYYGGVY